jgi:hypothetical protein
VNIGHPPASPGEQSSGAGGVVVVGGGDIAEGPDDEELWHAGSPSVTATMTPDATTGPAARRMYRFQEARVRSAAATRFILFGARYQEFDLSFLPFDSESMPRATYAWKRAFILRH